MGGTRMTRDPADRFASPPKGGGTWIANRNHVPGREWDVNGTRNEGAHQRRGEAEPRGSRKDLLGVARRRLPLSGRPRAAARGAARPRAREVHVVGQLEGVVRGLCSAPKAWPTTGVAHLAELYSVFFAPPASLPNGLRGPWGRVSPPPAAAAGGAS